MGVGHENVGWFMGAALTCAFFGCGGSGATIGGSSGDGGSATDAASSVAHDATAEDAASSAAFDPGTLGALVGSMAASDGGARGDAGVGATPAALNDSPEIVTGCEALCAKEARAGCSDAGTVDSCIVGCRLIVNSTGCSSQAQSLFSCASGAAVSCDSSGKPAFDGCGVEEVAAYACFLEKADDPTLADACTTYCANVRAAACPNDDPSGCVSGCRVLGNYVPGCDPAWSAYVRCANGATLACGSDGKAAASACGAQGLSFWACVAAGAASALNDGGS